MTLAAFLADNQPVIRVCITRVQGSSPREMGAEMLVTREGCFGTIGGGQLEYMALDQARRMLVQRQNHTHMNVPLGPEIGQCCGGRVELSLDRLDVAGLDRVLAEAKIRESALPRVLIFGAGHVGRALARAVAPLPLRATLIDSREDEMNLASDVDKCLTALPESMIRQAGTNTAYVIATHDHALDFLLAAEALQRGDAAYVGMIGSATKRARFENWSRGNAEQLNTTRLVCPMGGAGLGDKRPEVIAAFVAAELLKAVTVQNNIRQSMESDQ